MYRLILAQVTGLLLALAGLSVAAQPTITVHDAGAAPRQELRYRLEPGRTEYGAMQARTQVSGPMIPAVSSPPVTMSLMMRTTDVAGDGTARYEFELTAVDAALGAGALEDAEGFAGWARIDSRGRFLDGEFELEATGVAEVDQALSELNQSIQEMSAPFPEEPVGVGARWQVTTRIDTGGFTAAQITEYTLRAREGDRIDLDLTVSQSADSQQIAMPGMPPDISATLESLEASGSGTMSVDLRRLVPTSLLDVSVSMSMALDLQGQTQRMDMDLQSQTSIEPLDD